MKLYINAKIVHKNNIIIKPFKDVIIIGLVQRNKNTIMNKFMTVFAVPLINFII